ncbi:CRISPR-associated endonuclease Cas1 [Synergistales bacterium]|nr:CRISPR-associated endonuclease Cas1 [Synergistales bacterium]
MSQVYVNDPSSVVGFEDNRLQIKTNDGVLRSLPIESVDGISVFGRGQMSTQCIGECLRRGIDVQYYSSAGTYFGKLTSTQHVNIARQKRQVFMSENEEFKLRLSAKMLSAKIHNQITVARRYARYAFLGDSIDGDIDIMRCAEHSVSSCENIAEMMGHEGLAARAYFNALNKLVVPEFSFSGRSKQPPLDAFNSMLSLGYSILMNEVYGAIESKGLNPYFGLAHSDREKHPSLASDMMEEWRAVVVDSTVMSLVNGYEIVTSNFYTNTDARGVFLDREGMKIFIAKLEKKFAASSKYLTYADYGVPFRRALNMQAGEMGKAIEQGDADIYSPVTIR